MAPDLQLLLFLAGWGAPAICLCVGAAVWLPGGQAKARPDVPTLLCSGVAVAILLAILAYWTGLWFLVPPAVVALVLGGAVTAWRHALWRGIESELLLWAFGVGAHLSIFLAATATSGAHGDPIDLVFRLTGVTPGDAPNAFRQAQYFWNAAPLTQVVQGFSMVDRPFAGGFLTAALLAAVGQGPPPPGIGAPDLKLALYVGGWVGLNASVTIAFYRLAILFGARAAAPTIAIALTMSPVVLFLGLGVWPKLLALTMAVNGLQATTRRRFFAGGVSLGLAFLLHGSFLWFTLVVAALVCFVALATAGRVVGRMDLARFWLGLGPLVGGWFVFSHVVGADSALQYYYLYNAGVDQRLTVPAATIKHAFYESLSPDAVSLLGIVDFIRSLLPCDFVGQITRPLFPATGIKLSDLIDGIYMSDQRCFTFALGIASFAVLIHGLVNGARRDWRVKLCIALFLLTYVPGFFLYHREWYPDVTISAYSLIPIVAVLSLALADFEPAGRLVFLALCWIEYVAVMLLRTNVSWAPHWPMAYPYVHRGTLALVLALLVGIGYAIHRRLGALPATATFAGSDESGASATDITSPSRSARPYEAA